MNRCSFFCFNVAIETAMHKKVGLKCMKINRIILGTSSNTTKEAG